MKLSIIHIFNDPTYRNFYLDDNVRQGHFRIGRLICRTILRTPLFTLFTYKRGF